MQAAFTVSCYNEVGMSEEAHSPSDRLRRAACRAVMAPPAADWAADVIFSAMSGVMRHSSSTGGALSSTQGV